MASTVPLLLNRGIDLVTPPLLSEAGTLIDSLNYEMSADVGYRKWDGYERRDGFTTGGISRYFSFTTTTSTAAINVGDLLLDTDTLLNPPFGVVVEKVATNRINYIPFDSTHKLFAGDNVGTTPPNGPFSITNFVVLLPSVDGRTLISDPESYLTKIRSYSALLRAAVTDAPRPIAGLYYSRDRSYEVLDAPYLQYTNFGSTVPPPGEIVRWQGNEYYFIGRGLAPPIAGAGRNYLIPTGVSSGPVNDDLVGVISGTVYKTAVGTTLSTNSSDYGYLVYLGNPKTLGSGRGRIPIRPAISFMFNLGKFANANGPQPGQAAVVTTTGGGTLLQTGILSFANQTGGGYVAGTATGRAQFVNSSPLGTVSVRPYLIAGDEIHSSFPTSGSTLLMRVDSTIEATILAGRNKLYTNNTRYQWGTYNFYAASDRAQLYGVNGGYRAFWASPTGYGNIYTQDDISLDNPKYLTFHAGVQLGLGFAQGSFQLSVGGLPYDFAGVRGALEIGTGDDITGVLEGANDSSLIFGRRSIRRVTGTTDNTLALETISANAGAFNYTAVNVGATPVFTGPTGVSTLQQVQQYGDFVGERATSAISTWLIPKLVPEEGGLELSGVACALPVRGKQQYRLFLNSGDVINTTFTTEGPKTLRGNYKLPTQKPLVPLAWGSSVADDGNEHIEIVWDQELATRLGTSTESLPSAVRAYRIDNGWGFDGNTFEHWFDVTYTFVNNGAVATRVEKVRMYGMGYGIATLDLKASGIEKDFLLPFSARIQPINMPSKTQLLSDNMEPVTGIVDHQNWGYGIKLRINGTKAAELTTTEPSHLCQVLVLHLDEEGAQDN